MAERDSILDRVKTPLSFFTIVILVTEALLLIKGTDRTVFIGGMFILLLLTLLVVFMALFRPEALSGTRPLGSKIAVKGADSESSGKVEPALMFTESDSPEFYQHFVKLISNANTIVLIGTGINILRKDPIVKELMRRIKEHANFQLEIYAANPFSVAIENRLIEEETGSPTPIIGKSGLVKWLKMMLSEQENLGNPSNLTIKLFSHYPTLAVFIINGTDFLFYPYGYAHLGTLSPMVQYSKNNPEHTAIINFLEGQYNRIKNAAVDARFVFNIRENKVSPEQLNPFAVYFVPDSKTSLYAFGSQILGYDVHTQTQLETSWTDYIGAAANFGFHLTIADALYCASPNEVEVMAQEVKVVAQDFQPFTLNFEIQKDFPDEHSISLVCTDESGTLEALHFEMLCRCYKKAVASNYSLKLAEADRDTDIARAKLMIKHYKAPYILTRFKPHFTLLTKVPSEKKEDIFKELKNQYDAQVERHQIEIDTLAFMVKPDKNPKWEINHQFKLGE